MVNIGDIVWRADALDALIIPEDTKEMMLAFVETCTGRMDIAVSDDSGPRSGRGLNILLQ